MRGSDIPAKLVEYHHEGTRALHRMRAFFPCIRLADAASVLGEQVVGADLRRLNRPCYVHGSVLAPCIIEENEAYIRDGMTREGQPFHTEASELSTARINLPAQVIAGLAPRRSHSFQRLLHHATATRKSLRVGHPIFTENYPRVIEHRKRVDVKVAEAP